MSDTQSEQIVLSALLQRPERFIDLQAFEPSDFANPEARVIFMVIGRIHRAAARAGQLRYATADAVERGLRSMLVPVPGDKERTRRNAATLSAANAVLDTLATWPPVTEHEYADARDQLRLQATDIRSRDGIMRLVDKIDRRDLSGLHRDLADLAARVNPDAAGCQTATLSESVRLVPARYQQLKENGAGNIETPYPLLNKGTGGGRKGRLWVLGAYTGDGKTTLMVQHVYHALTTQGLGAALFVAEQTKEEIEDLFVLRHSHKFLPGGLDARRYLDGTLSAAEEKVLKQTCDDWATSGQALVSICQVPGGTTIGEVRSLAESLRSRHPVDIIGIDHSGLFNPTKPLYDRHERAAATIIEVKQLAMQFAGEGAWVMLPHQITREGNESALRRGYYIMKDLAATSEAERSADVVLWALRTPESKNVSEMTLGTCKDRKGKTIDAGFRVFERFESGAILPIH